MFKTFKGEDGWKEQVLRRKIMNTVSGQKSRETIGYLKNTPTEELLKLGEKKVLETFHRAAQRVPAYKEILQNAGINHKDIKTIQQFQKKVPFLDKHTTFARYEIEKLCVDGSLDGIVSVTSSSGSSGFFSYGVLTKQDIEDISLAHNLAMAYFFNADRRKTLFINCMSMGQRVYTDLAVLADTCVYGEGVLAIIRKLAHRFEQTVLVGNQAFIKKIIEDGQKEGIDWSSLLVHVAVGGEGMAENWRGYIARLLNIDLDKPETGVIITSGGIAELFLHSAFHETLETAKIRRLAHEDAKLRSELFGREVNISPPIFVYYPQRTYLEEIPSSAQSGELVFSSVGEEVKIPLLRYRTYDIGKMLSRATLEEVLRRRGYTDVALPELKLPIFAFYGRKHPLQINGQPVNPEAVKEALYLDSETATSVTGNFRLKSLNSVLKLGIQLKQGESSKKGLLRALEESVAKYLKVPANIKLYKYEDFPYGMRLDYERKFRYIDE